MNSFFSLLFRQKYILRWGLMRNITPESLAEHTAEVAVIAHALAVIGNTLYGKHYDPDRAAAAALFHDAPEVLTGDLPTPIKYFSPEMKNGYRAIEEHAVGTLLSKLPPELRDAYEPLLAPGGTDPDTHRLVKTADKLCAYLKCLTEEAGGNPEFRSARRAIEAELNAYDSPELRYFRDNLLEAFTLTIDEM